jgi:hypothetical protein
LVLVNWFWLIGFIVMVLEAFLGYKWFRSGFNKKWGLVLLVTLIIVFFANRMIKFEQVPAGYGGKILGKNGWQPNIHLNPIS